MAEQKFLVDLNLNQNQLKNAVIEKLASAPSSPAQGQVYYNTTDDTVYVWDGSAWTSITHHDLTIAAGSSDYLDITNHELSVKALAITNVEVEATYTNIADFVTNRYTVGNEFQEGDVIILVNGTDGSNRYIHNGGSAGTTADFTSINDVLNATEVRGYLTSGTGTTYDSTDGSFDVNVDNSSIKIVEGNLTVDCPTIGAQLAGDGIAFDATNCELDVNVDNATLEINTDIVRIKDSGVSTAKLADDSVTRDKINADVAGNGLVQNANGSLEVNVDSTLQIDSDTLGLKSFKANVGDGIQTTYTVSHNFNTKDVIVQVYEVSTGNTVTTENTRTTVNAVEIDFTTAPASNAYRVLVLAI